MVMLSSVLPMASISVYTLPCSVASPFFRDMFSLPQNSKDVQTIEMTEKADVLVTILRFIYPVEEPSPYAADLVLDVYRAADKLQIIKVQPVARLRLFAWLKGLPNPLEAWAVAFSLGIPEAITSAKRRFNLADTKTYLGRIPDYLKAIPVEEYAALIQSKDAAIEQCWQDFLICTCLCRDPAPDCPYCIRFVHQYRSTVGQQVFQPKATSLRTISKCHQFAKNYKCLNGCESRNDKDLDYLQRRLQYQFTINLSKIS